MSDRTIDVIRGANPYPHELPPLPIEPVLQRLAERESRQPTTTRPIQVANDGSDAFVGTINAHWNSRWSSWRRGSRNRLVLLLLGLVIAGSAAAATTLLRSSERLAASGQVNCFFGTSPKMASNRFTFSLEHFAVPTGGRDPLVTCRRLYAEARRAGIAAPGVVKLVSCRRSALRVSVFVATGAADQCQRLGYQPLPQDYRAALTQVHRLLVALTALQRERSCWSPAALATAIHRALVRLGFSGWTVALPPPGGYPPTEGDPPAGTGLNGTNGPCGAVDSISAIDGRSQSVHISPELPPSVTRLIAHTEYQLITATAGRCYTPASVRALVRRAYMHTTLRPRFATVAMQGELEPGSPRQRRYARGCVIVASDWPALNERYVDVVLNARSAPRLPAGRLLPPATAFRP